MIWNIKTTLDFNYLLPFTESIWNWTRGGLSSLAKTSTREMFLNLWPNHAFSKLFIKNKNHQRIRTNRFSSFVFKVSMSKTLPKAPKHWVDSTAVSIFVDVLVELTNTVCDKMTKLSTNIETAVLSSIEYFRPIECFNSHNDIFINLQFHPTKILSAMYATTRLLEPVMDCHTGCSKL